MEFAALQIANHPELYSSWIREHLGFTGTSK
jgi:hypothetical protein